ncbi:MAG: hypothetical protein ABJH68_16960 [Ilumatobacter sp.]|uniref:hypothetical protein n=1 Tax=Ilumatobacter sp. TaxID=1967498 RepID=UPI0032993E60
MEEIRRADDGELCGYVEFRDGSWSALVVFGAVLGHHSTRDDAVDHVLAEGLASLAERWTLRNSAGSDDVVCVQEANELCVTLALGYSSMPGVPTLTVTKDELDAGTWSLRRERAPLSNEPDPASGGGRGSAP